MPSCRATASAVVRLSPVSITTRSPSSCKRASASGVVAFTGSAIAITPASRAVDGDEHHRRALLRSSLRLAPQRARVDAELARNVALPSATARALDRARDALAGRRVEVRRRRRAASPRSCAAATIAAASGCSLARSSAGGEAQHVGFRHAPSRRPRRSRCGLPSVSVPVLSTTSVSTFSSRSSASAFLISTPGLRAAPDADHDRHRRREAERARAGDDQHRHGGDQAVGEARLRAPDAPRRRTPATATASTAGTNQPATRSASRWIGARLRCASATICDDLRQHRVACRPCSARITSAPVPLIVPPITLSPAAFVDRHRSPVTIDSSTALRPSITVPSTGTLSPGPHAQPVADLRPGRARSPRSPPSASQPPRGLRRQVEQRPDGAAGLLARAQLQHLPEQHQHGDDRGRLEIDRRPSRRASRNAAGNRPGASVATTL